MTQDKAMTKLPPLTGWEQSAHSLHQAAALLGAIRMLVNKPVPNYLERSSQPLTCRGGPRGRPHSPDCRGLSKTL